MSSSLWLSFLDLSLALERYKFEDSQLLLWFASCESYQQTLFFTYLNARFVVVENCFKRAWKKLKLEKRKLTRLSRVCGYPVVFWKTIVHACFLLLNVCIRFQCAAGSLHVLKYSRQHYYSTSTMRLHFPLLEGFRSNRSQGCEHNSMILIAKCSFNIGRAYTFIYWCLVKLN